MCVLVPQICKDISKTQGRFLPTQTCGAASGSRNQASKKKRGGESGHRNERNLATKKNSSSTERHRAEEQNAWRSLRVQQQRAAWLRESSEQNKGFEPRLLKENNLQTISASSSRYRHNMPHHRRYHRRCSNRASVFVQPSQQQRPRQKQLQQQLKQQHSTRQTTKHHSFVLEAPAKFQ